MDLSSVLVHCNARKPLKPPELLFLFQVVPYCTGCKAALSKFKAAIDYRVGYLLPGSKEPHF
jgi:hypothetical protein